MIYLAPKEIGGFFENTFFLGIFYYFHYAVIASPYASWVVYIPAIYYLGMAVVEILVVLGHAVGLFPDFPTLLYWIARVAVIITAIVIGVTGGGTSTEQRDRKWEKRAKELYEQCVSLVQLDFTRSYELATDSRSLGGDFTPPRFLYDADKNAGGLYRDNADGGDIHGTTYFTGTGYRVRLEDRNGVFAVTAISVYFEYDERDNNDWLINTWYFDMLLFIEDCYHIPAP